MPTTHHCMVCQKTGYCLKHMVVLRAVGRALPPELRLDEAKKMAEGRWDHADEAREVNAYGATSCEGEELEEEDVEELKKGAMKIAMKSIPASYRDHLDLSLAFLARGGYHYVWLVTASIKASAAEADLEMELKFVLRISRDTPSLQPYQTQNEVGCLTYLAHRVPGIPAPKVYNWNEGTSESDSCFIAEEFIDGERLSVAWPRLTEEQKTTIIREIAEVTATLGETRFSSISGMLVSGSAGPTTEAAKVLNGRAIFHSRANYDIGPYRDSKAYILACFDREIYYYTHATESEVAETGLEATPTSITNFVHKLQAERESLHHASALYHAIDAEPLVLVHEDFHSGNLLVRNGHLVGVLDWEFSGVYPLSELLGPIAVLQVSEGCRGEITEEEEEMWHQRYRTEVERVIRAKGWREEDIKTVMGAGHSILHTARSIMLPDYEGD